MEEMNMAQRLLQQTNKIIVLLHPARALGRVMQFFKQSSSNSIVKRVSISLVNRAISGSYSKQGVRPMNLGLYGAVQIYFSHLLTAIDVVGYFIDHHAVYQSFSLNFTYYE
jgi:hypothetical protein